MEYTVTTLCFTYNQAPYIGDALRGFAMQEAGFPMAFVVVDDASTDGEPEVLRQWAETHLQAKEGRPLWADKPYGRLAEGTLVGKENLTFAILLLAENHYRTNKPKGAYLAEWCDRSSYRAFCEGDDYWTEADKLARQVAFLEGHPEYGLVYSKARVYRQDAHKFSDDLGDGKCSFEEILLRNPIVTLTACLRASLYKAYLAQKEQWDCGSWLMGDYPIWIWMAYHSQLKFEDEYTGVYRQLDTSMSHFKDLDDQLAFADSSYAIQMFFADLFHVDERVRKDISYRADVVRAQTCLTYGSIGRALKHLKPLTPSDKLFLLKTTLKAMLR